MAVFGIMPGFSLSYSSGLFGIKGGYLYTFRSIAALQILAPVTAKVMVAFASLQVVQFIFQQDAE